MKRLQYIYSSVLFGLLILTFLSYPVKALNGWSSPIQLTFSPTLDYLPCISGDGSKIAFTSDIDGDNEVFVINSDGSGLTQLTSNTALDYSISINNDGSKIAFLSDVDGKYEAFVINSDGSGLTQVTNNNVSVNNPSISGDGSKIVFSSDVDGFSEVFVINSDGTGLTQLTSSPLNKLDPCISGDGSKIVFSSYVDVYSEIFIINSDGTGLTMLANSTYRDGRHSISGDGSKVAFQRMRWPDYPPEIFVINSDGTGITQLTNDAVPDWSPSINWDGSKIAFLSDSNEGCFVFVTNSDGTGRTQLSDKQSTLQKPSINNDGTKVAFYQYVEGSEYDIFVVNYTGKETPSLTVRCSPCTVDKTGTNTTTISGYLKSGNVGIEGTDIISLSYSDGSFEVIETCSTDNSGFYQFDWDVPDSLANGQYFLKAEFAGDSNYNPISAETSDHMNLFVVPEYWMGTLAVSACFLALIIYYVKSRET